MNKFSLKTWPLVGNTGQVRIIGQMIITLPCRGKTVLERCFIPFLWVLIPETQTMGVHQRQVPFFPLWPCLGTDLEVESFGGLEAATCGIYIL